MLSQQADACNCISAVFDKYKSYDNFVLSSTDSQVNEEIPKEAWVPTSLLASGPLGLDGILASLCIARIMKI